MIHKDILERHKPKWNISTQGPSKRVLKHQILQYNSLKQPYNFRAEKLPAKVPLQFPLAYDKFHFDERRLYTRPAAARRQTAEQGIDGSGGGRGVESGSRASLGNSAGPVSAGGSQPSTPHVDIFLGDYDPSLATVGPDSPDSAGEKQARDQSRASASERALQARNSVDDLQGEDASEGRQSRRVRLATTVNMSRDEVLATRVVNTRTEIPTAPTLSGDKPEWDVTTSPDRKALKAQAHAEWRAVEARRKALARSSRRHPTLMERTQAISDQVRRDQQRKQYERQRLRELYGPTYELETDEERVRRAARKSFRPRFRARNRVPRTREYFHLGVLQDVTMYAAGDGDDDSDAETQAWSCCMGAPSTKGCAYRYLPDNRSYLTSLPRLDF
ncbi:uncharacterized protein AMSG_01389 [Thecamonas trahens ATCC 50062]|uniref:Uncharacterized protein n=1 Tax=Thecamonas trahens ATCC 50062 TaxID=461836 RepID=A0A0L0DQI5_THETB|nr:hypothetical protein AMSG_01389 [Thecamonas trahens ATCC 50062]KNC53678.1 hypothetical protein AMSG_01389 [Thecamonas trahens ATCC 50062]|eukprot:XP_013761992.1 hypothetical protein AMSG_01389 [Thecamonas trahens ATCC 50062]